MDFDFTVAETTRLVALRDLIDGYPTAPRRASDAGAYDAAVDDAIRGSDVLTGAGLTLLDRILLVEEAARLGAPINATASLLLAPLAGVTAPSGAIAVSAGGADRARSSPRFQLLACKYCLSSR